jgi:antitoxin component YwqK of YwqJK toxin-antitoxin module
MKMVINSSFTFTPIILLVSSCVQQKSKIINRYPNNQPKTEYTYSRANDTSTYICKVYTEDGKLLYKTTVVNDRFVGEKLVYYKSGKLKRIEKLRHPIETDDSTYDCRIINLWPNGSMKSRYEYRNNTISGIAEDYDSTGHLKGSRNYINGKINGKEITYFPNGRIQRIAFVKNDTIHGYELYFDEYGDTLKWFNNSTYGVNGIFSKKILRDGNSLLGQYSDSTRSTVVWKWYDKNNKLIKSKVDSGKNEMFISPE